MLNDIYKTQNKEYNPYWKISNSTQVNQEDIPTHAQINQKFNEIKKAKINMIKSLQHNKTILSEEEKIRKQALQNCVKSKPF